MEIINMPRTHTDELSENEIDTLKTIYVNCHPEKVDYIYLLVADFANHHTMEKVMDKLNELELELHRPKQLSKSQIQAWCKNNSYFISKLEKML